MANEREFFRVTLYEAPIKIKDLWKIYKGVIRDVSGNGISFQCIEQFEVGKKVNVIFQINEITFSFHAQIIRKGNGTIGRYLYACQFLDQTEKEKSELSATLLRLEADRRKN